MEEKQRLSALYTPASFYMLRVPALSSDVFIALSTNPYIASEDTLHPFEATLSMLEEYCCHQLQELMSQPQIRLALAVASPSLFEEFERSHRESRLLSHKKRMYASLLRYVTRMCTRPTPFGLFSGIAIGAFANKTTALLAFPTIHHIRTRPDMNWLLTLLKKVEEMPELVSQLKVNTNQTVYIVGNRAILPIADIYGQNDNRSISLRATPVVRKALEIAHQPVQYSELRTALLEEFPIATEQQINQLLWQLWEHHFLVSDLHPPLTNANPANYIYKYLLTLQGAENIRGKLYTVLKKATDLDIIGAEAEIGYVQDLISSQKQLVSWNGEQPQFQVDAALHMKYLHLNVSIGKAAALAAEILLRLSPLPEGWPHIHEYRLWFLEKYGENAEIPLLDLLSPEKGLDAPNSYNQPPRTYPRPASEQQPDNKLKRDCILQSLVAEAINNRNLEVELTETHLQRLEYWSPQMKQAPRSLEIYLQIHSESKEALDRGEWSAVITPNVGSHAGGRTFGRFFDLLDQTDKDALQQFVELEEKLCPHAIFAELSYQPRHARTANVAIRPALHLYEIVVGTTPTVPADRVITLNDLVVGVQNGRFYLRSLRLGKRVTVCQNHALNATYAPNVCRFLTELGHDGFPLLNDFDWGIASMSPFLPRVIVKTGPTSTLVLKPASWTLSADTIKPIGDGNAQMRWFQGVQYWREQWRVPRYVYLKDFDNRLLLDLKHPMMVSELYAKVSQLKEYNLVILEELFPDLEHLWLQNEQGESYFAEIVVPLLRKDAVESQGNLVQSMTIPHATRIITQKERNFFPGDSWIFFKLYAPYKQHNAILAGPLRRIIQSLQEENLLDCWFFIRYSDPEPHLRLRLRAKSTQGIQQLLITVLQWCRQLAESEIIQRYAVDTYEREVERYGGPLAIDFVEQIFCIDSTTICDIIAAQHMNKLTLDPMAIAVFTIDHYFSSWGFSFEQRLQWLQKIIKDKYLQRKEYRPHRKLYSELLSPWETKPNPELMNQRTLLLALMKHQEIPLANFAMQIRLLSEENELWVEEDILLRSLAHMHKIRLLGLDHQQEHQMYAFWLHTLETIRLRPAKKVSL